MQTSPRTRARNQLIFSLALLAIAIAGYLVTRSFTPQAAPDENASSTVATTTQDATSSTSSVVTPSWSEPVPAGQQSIEGTYVCLPHKDTGGPQTLECALGLKADDGKHYALVSAGATSYSASATTPTGVRVRVTGHVTPTMALSDSRWEVYDIAGTISVTTFTKI